MTRTATRFTLTISLAIAALLAGIVTAIASGTAPPRIAFVARGDGTNFVDALAVGSVAGQLGAGVFITDKSALPLDTENGLIAYNAAYVIIAGGPGAVSDAVRLAIIDATGLPGDKVIRAAGATRWGTAVAINELLDDLDGVDYTGAWLPVHGTATNSLELGGLTPSELRPFAFAGGTAALTTFSSRLVGTPLSVSVPAGYTATLLLTFSAESACTSDGAANGLNDYCSIVFEQTGVGPLGDSLDAGFDSTDDATAKGSGWESHSIRVVLPDMAAGTHEFVVRMHARDQSSKGDTVTFRIDDWVFTVDAILEEV